MNESLIFLELMRDLLDCTLVRLAQGFGSVANLQQAVGNVIKLLSDLKPLGLRIYEGVLSGIGEVLIVVLKGLILILHIFDELDQLVLFFLQL